VSVAAAAPEKPRPQPPRPRTPATGNDLAGLKVLLVDDDPHNLYAVTTLLEKLRVKVRVAASARECYEALAENPDVDVVLMDVMMPEIDGLEATQHIRERFASLPVIALTAKALPGDKERCLAAGCSDFATKPVTPERLAELLRKWGSS
jgi:CheY-like chemotaxis protein